ncbi:hypothetical protein [Clostridium perfringens]|uniref:hypothetical protein n=1 Tax=Clostridium perfringens TaxID=1502 RepID=UPI0018E42FC7|nr:hypothetical protein [Clostridium perfringens]MBI5996799.1 hypothetical protein [Clostridium perfringens]MDG6891194.1 hypothetical protein [Clostridium perfringens]
MKNILSDKLPIIFESGEGICIDCSELYRQLTKCGKDSISICRYKSWLYNKIVQYKFKYGKDYIFKFRKKDRYLQENEIDRLGIDWKSYKKNRKFTEEERQILRNKRIKLDCFISQDIAIQLCIISDTKIGKMLREEMTKKILNL